MVDMERKYAEIISKHGPLFMNLKYLERLNLDETSLVREKWTTELFAEDVEVMPIIFENEEYRQQDEYEDQTNENSEATCSGIMSKIDIESDSSEEELHSALPNLPRSSRGEAWWITLNDDTEFEHFRPQQFIAGSSEQLAEDLEPLSGTPDSTSINFTKTYTENESNTIPVAKKEMEVLFRKVTKTTPEHEMDTMCDVKHIRPFEKYVQTSTYLHQKVTPEEHSTEEKNAGNKLQLPWSIPSEKSLHEIKSGRISRPLSGKYSVEKEDENFMKRTDSVMDLTSHIDRRNLSSMYDDLYAEINEKNPRPLSTRPKTLSSVTELFRNPGCSERVLFRDSKSSVPRHGTGKTELSEANLVDILLPEEATSITQEPKNIYPTSYRKQKPMLISNSSHNEFATVFENTNEKLSRKRTHEHK